MQHNCITSWENVCFSHILTHTHNQLTKRQIENFTSERTMRKHYTNHTTEEHYSWSLKHNTRIILINKKWQKFLSVESWQNSHATAETVKLHNKDLQYIRYIIYFRLNPLTSLAGSSKLWKTIVWDYNEILLSYFRT